jgi:signal transduction histidine kinase
LRPPLAAGLIVFLVAVVTTQIALWAADRDADRQIHTLSRVYLAGIADAVAPTLASNDVKGFESRFAAAVADHEGIVERVLFAFRPDGSLVATAGDRRLSADDARTIKADGFRIDEEPGIAWVSRRLTAGDEYVLVSGLDVSEIIGARNRLRLSIAGIDLILASVCGLFTYMMLRRMNRRLTDVVDHLAAASSGDLSTIPDEEIESAEGRVAAIYRSFNMMLESVRERERLQHELAEREQSAALGRLAATIAHEVRNPLGGLATAVSTLKRFGHDADVRTESLGFLERGIETVDKIVTSTLNLYRAEDDRQLTAADFSDLRRLVQAAAERGAVSLTWDVQVPDTLSVAAVGAQQVMLNLLLNACAVTPPGGKVSFRARIDNSMLECEIRDQGQGMPASRAGQLRNGTASDKGSKRIGIDVIVALLDTLDGSAQVESDQDGGSRVLISIPMEPADV